MFQKENAVGEYVDVISNGNYHRFIVIGVIEDLPASKKKKLEFNRIILKNNTEEFNNSCVAYTTCKYIENFFRKNEIETRYILNVPASENEYQLHKLVDTLNSSSRTFLSDTSIVSQNVIINDVKYQELQMKGMINVIVLVIILISGFMIITIYFFSVKERTYEIGLKRSLGASELDIVIQYIIEGVLTSLIAAMLTLVVGVYLCNYATYFIINELFIDVDILLSWKIVFAMFSLSLLQGIVFSIIPAIVASKIRPIEALRWD